MTEAQSITVTAVAEMVTDLLDAIAEIEDGDGGWPGADVVDEVCSWLRRLGLDTEKSAREMAATIREAAGIPYVP